MTNEKIKEKVIKVAYSVISDKISLVEIDISSLLTIDLGLDSLDILDLIFEVEEEFKEFNIKFSEIEIKSFQTLNDIAILIEEKIEEKKVNV